MEVYYKELHSYFQLKDLPQKNKNYTDNLNDELAISQIDSSSINNSDKTKRQTCCLGQLKIIVECSLLNDVEFP